MDEDCKEISAYIGIQNNPEGDEPSLSAEFNISLKVFIIAYILSKLETNDSNC